MSLYASLWRNPESKTRRINPTRGKGTKLTTNDVRRIKFLRGIVPGKTLAELYGVSRPLISQIQAGKRWGHVR